MSIILAEKYAQMLTMPDFISLYKMLEKSVGSRSLAAKKCGIERKTIYGWDTTKEIRRKTRERILAVLLEELTEETLDFLTKRSVESSTDVLRTYLSSLYEKAMDLATSNDEFGRLTSKFEQVRHEYESLIDNDLQPEIGMMLQETIDHAKEIDQPFKKLPPTIIRLNDFSCILPDLLKTMSASGPYFTTNNISEYFNLPLEFVNTLSAALHDNFGIPTKNEVIKKVYNALQEDMTTTIGTINPTLQEGSTYRLMPEFGFSSVMGGAT